ncbi:major histocompatibility complex class I-related gene protein-like [Scomber japonicus]|uniref:major histocompatibility complex class I-related gene protein-like n=1 Tax=Scomber japonicus TaxID=13676 RepID=UPI002306A86E|nr:major histocompatibility complex class I-related gene protein-like [Scomber japonicus]
MRLIVFIIFFTSCNFAFSVKHSLSYILTATDGVPNFPEFMAAGVFDDVQMAYCDSDRKRIEPRTSWMDKLLKENPDVLQWHFDKCHNNQYSFRHQINNVKQRFNQSEGAHVFQRMNGCEWDDETGDITGFSQFGYDGDDLIALDLDTLTWIAPTQQTVMIKHDWDRDTQLSLFWKNAIIHDCMEYLKKFVHCANSTVQAKDLPSVSLLQKTPSSPVSCFATGFYPARAKIFWRKDGEELHEDVELGEILPNHDGSFQMSVDLDLSSVTSEDWRRYECVFHLSGVKDDIITKLDKTVIKTNCGKTGIRWNLILGTVVLIIASVTGLALFIATLGGY